MLVYEGEIQGLTFFYISEDRKIPDISKRPDIYFFFDEVQFICRIFGSLKGNCGIFKVYEIPDKYAAKSIVYLARIEEKLEQLSEENLEKLQEKIRSTAQRGDSKQMRNILLPLLTLLEL